MRRVLLLALVAAAIAALWWKRDDATRIAIATVPALAPYLPPTEATPKPAAAARPAPPPTPVLLAKAEVKPLPLTVEAVGTVQSMASIQIKSRIDSQIVAISVEEGARVKAGDLLVTLDSRAIRAQLLQAEATIAKDRAQLEQQRRDLARAEDLLAKRIGSEVQRDTYATNVKVGEAQLAADTAQRDTLQTSLSYTEIKAPISGRIGSIALKVGTTVKASDLPIATINQIDPIFISFSVPQSVFGDLRAALAAGTVPVNAKVGGGKTVSGAVSFVENTVDLSTGTVLAKAVMANSEEQLWPGQFVSVSVVLGEQANAVAVPSAAVQLGQQGAYLFVVKEGRRAALTPVTVARTVGALSVIASGLSGGEDVVVDGQLRLVNGATVQVRPSRDGVARSPADPAERRS